VRARAVAPAWLACAIAAVALASCGDDAKTTGSGEGAEPSGTSTVTTTAAPTSTAATTTTTPTATTGVPEGGVTTGETTPSTGESGEGGAGDEEPARVPVALTHSGGALSPTTVTVPAFLTLEIRISGPATTATLPGGGRLTVPGTKTIPGLKPGKYAISTADGGRTTLDVVSGGDPGP
jgi:hypothetical protein